MARYPCQDLPPLKDFDMKSGSKRTVRSVHYHLECCMVARGKNRGAFSRPGPYQYPLLLPFVNSLGIEKRAVRETLLFKSGF